MIFTAIIVLLIFIYGSISKKLERSVLTAPMIFTLAGMLAAALLPLLASREHWRELFLYFSELGLVLLLFTDASRTDLGVLRRIQNLPIRLLSIGMPLTIILGAVAALIFLKGLSIYEAVVLAAILAPTDAGLGQVIISSERVPVRIRQALTVEAGLNDGLSVPFLLLFYMLAASQAEWHHSLLLKFLWEQLGLGTLIGATIGLIGGWWLNFAKKQRLMAESLQQLCLVCLPLLCLLTAEFLNASMFIAAFVAGLTVQVKFKEAGTQSVEFSEEWGELINWTVFFLFGMLAASCWPHLKGIYWMYAILSLTVVRVLPVALSMIGTRLGISTILFLGWFGPRGLASIVLGLVFLKQEGSLPGEATISLATIATVWLSIFSHGLTAMPGLGLYSKSIARYSSDAPELKEV